MGIYLIYIQYSVNIKFKENGIITTGVVVAYKNVSNQSDDSELNPIINYHDSKGDIYHFTDKSLETELGDTLEVVFLNNNPLQVRVKDKVLNKMGYIQGGILLGACLLFLVILIHWELKGKFKKQQKTDAENERYKNKFKTWRD